MCGKNTQPKHRSVDALPPRILVALGIYPSTLTFSSGQGWAFGSSWHICTQREQIHVRIYKRCYAHAGPGAYSSECLTRTGKTLDYLSKPGATSAFKAGPHQLIMSGNLDAPPPTAYTMVSHVSAEALTRWCSAVHHCPFPRVWSVLILTGCPSSIPPDQGHEVPYIACMICVCITGPSCLWSPMRICQSVCL